MGGTLWLLSPFLGYLPIVEWYEPVSLDAFVAEVRRLVYESAFRLSDIAFSGHIAHDARPGVSPNAVSGGAGYVSPPQEAGDA